MSLIRLFVFLLFFLPFQLPLAQVGINTTNPQGALDIVSLDSGMLIPRVSSTAVVNPVANGTLIYDLSSNCVKIYERDQWSKCITGTGNLPSIFNNCPADPFKGVYKNDGTTLDSSHYFELTLTNHLFSSASLSFSSSDLTLSGPGIGTGSVSVDTPDPTSVNLASGASVTVKYGLSGSIAGGEITGTWSLKSMKCIRSVTAQKGGGNFVLPHKLYVFSMTDPILSDVQGVFNGFNTRASSNQFGVFYSNGFGSIDAYTSTWMANNTGSGEQDSNKFQLFIEPTVLSNTFNYVDFKISVDTDQSFNVKKLPLDAEETIVSLPFVVNDSQLGTVSIIATGGIKDKYFSTLNHNFVYLPILGEDGNTWLNLNLGAHYANSDKTAVFEPTARPSNTEDYNAYGSWFQWGRPGDGHELVDWISFNSATLSNTTTSLSINTTPPHLSFITSNSDWLFSPNDTLWESESKPNNPCPDGYRIPTLAEFQNYANTLPGKLNFSSFDITNKLKLTPGGFRYETDGSPSFSNSSSSYWTSTVSGSTAKTFELSTSTPSSFDAPRASGAFVRCIKD